MFFFQQLKNKYNSKFVKNVLTLFSGSVIGQGIVFLIIPILTRLFSKEAFGTFALYSSVVLISNTIVTLRYELSIVLPKRIKDAVNLFMFNLLIVAIISLILFFIVLIYHIEIIELLKIQKIGYFIYFVPLSVFLIGNITAFNYWNNKTNHFKNISFGLVSKSATMSTSQLLIGISFFKYIGLIPGMIAGQFVNFLVLVKLSFKEIYMLKKYVSLKRMCYLASKYKDIPLFNTILSFTNILSNELPVILITRFFGLSSVGIYSLAVKVSKVPPGIIGQSISQVFFNEASKVYNSGGNLYVLIKKTYKNLLISAFFIFIPVFAISFFLDYIFGNEWAEVGVFVRILLPWLFFMFLTSPISSLIVILNKQKTILIFDLLLLLSRFLSLYFGYIIYNDVIIALFLFSSVGILFNILILLYFFRITKQSINQKEVYK